MFPQTEETRHPKYSGFFCISNRSLAFRWRTAWWHPVPPGMQLSGGTHQTCNSSASNVDSLHSNVCNSEECDKVPPWAVTGLHRRQNQENPVCNVLIKCTWENPSWKLDYSASGTFTRATTLSPNQTKPKKTNTQIRWRPSLHRSLLLVCGNFVPSSEV